MTRALSILVAAVLLATAGPLEAKGKKSSATITVVNLSNWDIHEIYLSPVDRWDWGPDLLGPFDVLETGERLKIRDIRCDRYDVKIVDEDHDECILGDVAICGSNDTWVVTDDDLLTCQLLTN
jgi:hypothetical protein